MTKGTFDKGDIARLMFSIGKRRMVMKAEVRWSLLDGDENFVGLQFVKPEKQDVAYITSIFTAMHLR